MVYCGYTLLAHGPAGGYLEMWEALTLGPLGSGQVTLKETLA